MNGYLLDTDVVSMLSPARLDASAAFVDWVERSDAENRLFLSVVTVQEIEKAAAGLERKGAAAKGAALKAWLAGLLAVYGDKVLGVDAAAAALVGRLEAKASAAGHEFGVADALVAGLAQAHGLVVVTRHSRNFLPFGVSVLDPDDVSAG